MSNLFKGMAFFYNDIARLCKKDAYNLVLHKHLGDVFYAIASKPFFESQYNAPLHFIIRPQHEFLMKMFGVKSYSVYDLDSLVKKNKDCQKSFFDRHKRNVPIDVLENIVYQVMFPGMPVKKGVPFVCENLVNDFVTYDRYWCYRWIENMGLDANIKFLLPKHEPDLSEKSRKILQKIAPLDKIVLFAPEAATFQEYDADFWNIMADAVHAKGYRIIVNSNKFQIKHGISAFDLNLSLEDVVALGLKCAYVFALRSGLCDVLVNAGKKLYVFYPAMARRELYSMSYPFATNTGVHEFQMFNWKIDKVVLENEDLTEKLQKYTTKLHRRYILETVKRMFSFGGAKSKHAIKRALARDLGGISKIFFDNNIQNPAPLIDINLKPLYTKHTTQNTWGVETKYSLLGGVLTMRKDSQGTQRLRLCGITCYSKRNKNGFRTTRLFWIPVHKKNLKKELMDKILQNIDDKYDDIYIIRHNIGETYVYLGHLQNWIKKNGSKKPLLLVWQKKDMPLYKMFVNKNITLQYQDISQQDIHNRFTEEFLEYKGHRIFCPTPDIAANILEKRKEVSTWTFYNHICKDFAMDAKDKLTKPVVPEEVKNSIKIKTSQYFKRPFVIIIPNANSLRQMPVEFWNKVIHQLHALGYDVFINSHRTKKDDRNGLDLSETITFDCDLAEMYELSRQSAGVITLASGLAVFLTANGGKIDLIYTKTHPLCHKIIPADLMQSMYSVYNLPGLDDKNIKEYNADMYSPDELADIILSGYKKI